MHENPHETSIITNEDVLKENNHIHKLLKKFSSLLSNFIDNSPPFPHPKPQKPHISYESLEKLRMNNVNYLKNLQSEYQNLLKHNESIRDVEIIDFEIENIKKKIKGISSEIQLQKLNKIQNSKELDILETMGFSVKKREFQRFEKEFMRNEMKNLNLKEKTKKIEENLDKYLGKFDKIKERYTKHLTVAQNLHINLDKNLQEKYDKIQEKINIEAENFLILNKRDEINYKTIDKKKHEIFLDLQTTNEKIHDFQEKIQEQEDFLQELDSNNFEITEEFSIKYYEILKDLKNIGIFSEKKSEKEGYLREIRSILSKEIDPRRLFMEKPFRFHQKKPIIEKELKKPVSLMDLNKNRNYREDNSNNSHIMSIEKVGNNANNKGNYAFYNENYMYSRPFQIKKTKKKEYFNEKNNKKNEENMDYLNKQIKNNKESDFFFIEQKKLKENQNFIVKKEENDRVWTQEKKEENPLKIEKSTKFLLENSEIPLEFDKTQQKNPEKIYEIPLKIEKKDEIWKNSGLSGAKEVPKVKSFNFNQKKEEIKENNVIKTQELELPDTLISKKTEENNKKTLTFIKENEGNQYKNSYFNENEENTQKNSYFKEKKPEENSQKTFNFSKENPLQKPILTQKNNENSIKTFNLSKENLSEITPKNNENTIKTLNLSKVNPFEITEKPTIIQKNNENSSKTFNFNQKKGEFPKNNIFQENTDDFFEIPEIKAEVNKEEIEAISSLKNQKKIENIEIFSFDESKKPLINKKEEITKENNSGTLKNKMNNLRIKLENKENKEKQNLGLFDSEGKNTFFDDFDIN